MKLLMVLTLTFFLTYPAYCIRFDQLTNLDKERLLDLGFAEESTCLIFTEDKVLTGVLVDKACVLTVAHPFVEKLPHLRSQKEFVSVQGIAVFSAAIDQDEIKHIQEQLRKDPDLQLLCAKLYKFYGLEAVPFNKMSISYDFKSIKEGTDLALIPLYYFPKNGKPICLLKEEDIFSSLIENQALSPVRTVGYGYGFTKLGRLNRIRTTFNYAPIVKQKNASWLLHFGPNTPQYFSETALKCEDVGYKQWTKTIESILLHEKPFCQFTRQDTGSPILYKGSLCGIYSHNVTYPRFCQDDPDCLNPYSFKNAQIVGKSTPLWTKGAQSALTLMRAMLRR